jgi:hypothetical protein
MISETLFLFYFIFLLPESVFGSVVAGAFQIAFRAEMHANDFFYFLKIIFDISTSKRSKKYKPHSILAKKKIQICTKRRYKHSTKRSLNHEQNKVLYQNLKY